jgi:hypothetical protein
MNYLSKIQGALKAPKAQKNTFGNYNYRSCEDILEALKPLINPDGYSIILIDEMVSVGARVYVCATATLSNGEETYTSKAYAREEEIKKGMDGAQITGAASSYARKYALNGLFAIDDTKDADSANRYEKEEKATAPQKLPSLTTKAYETILKRIVDGETDLIEKAEKAFRITPEQKNNLLAAVQKAQAAKIKTQAPETPDTTPKKPENIF